MSIAVIKFQGARANVSGGGGPSVLPSDFSGLQKWYRSIDLSLSDNDPVSTWTDRTSNHSDATATGTGRPTYKTSVVDSQPMLRFDGTANFFDIPSVTFASADCTIVFLLKTISLYNYNPIIGSRGSVTGYMSYDYFELNYLHYYNGSGGYDSDVFDSANNLKMISIVSSFSGNTIKVRENKTSRNQFSSVYSVVFNTLGNFADGLFYTGDIYEVLIYNTALTAANLDSLYDSYFKYYLPSLP